MFSLQGFGHSLPSIPWGETVLFEKPQVCGQAQVVSAGTSLICGLLLCSELEEIMKLLQWPIIQLNNKCTGTQMKLRVPADTGLKKKIVFTSSKWVKLRHKEFSKPHSLSSWLLKQCSPCFICLPSALLTALHKSTYVKRSWKRNGKDL